MDAHLWLEITMHDPVLSHQGQRHQHLIREATNKGGCEPDESVSFNELVQIDAQQFHCNAQMIAEIEMLIHLYDMVLFVRVLNNKACRLVLDRKKKCNTYPCTEFV
jgi:hypothetical protein